MKTQNLTLIELITALKNTKLGIYHSFTKKHVEDNGYYFIKTYVGRLCDYENMKSTKEYRLTHPKTITNGGSGNVQVIIPNVLYYFTNTGNYNISVKTINEKKHSKTIYFDNNGKEITQAEYELVNPPKKNHSNGGTMFYINLLELIEVK